MKLVLERQLNMEAERNHEKKAQWEKLRLTSESLQHIQKVLNVWVWNLSKGSLKAKVKATHNCTSQDTSYEHTSSWHTYIQTLKVSLNPA